MRYYSVVAAGFSAAVPIGEYMKITGITAQTKNQNRVNVMVDGVYRLSLDVFQLVDLGIRVGKEYTEQELVDLEIESQFGKTYARALNLTSCTTKAFQRPAMFLILPFNTVLSVSLARGLTTTMPRSARAVRQPRHT